MSRRNHVNVLQAWSRAAIAGAALTAASACWSAENYQPGIINNITTIPEGVLLMLDSGPPTNCAGTAYGWMLVPEANKTMVATVLMMWISGQRKVVVYSQPYTGTGVCTLTQVDPE